MFTSEKITGDRLLKNLNRAIEHGVRAATSVLNEGYTSPGGIPKMKTKSDRRDDMLRLKTIAEVLDLLQWYGEWGTTPTGIELELVRRAKIVRAFGK